jgi:hypothetical protein
MDKRKPRDDYQRLEREKLSDGAYIHVRVPKSLRHEFVSKCDANGATYSKLVRAWVEEYVKQPAHGVKLPQGQS